MEVVIELTRFAKRRTSKYVQLACFLRRKTMVDLSTSDNEGRLLNERGSLVDLVLGLRIFMQT